MMNPLHIQRRLIPSHKKKTGKKDLPEIKQPVVLIKKLNNSGNYQSDNFKIMPYCPLLSNVLVSKRIDPPPPPRLVSLIKDHDNSRLFHNFRLREQSAQFKKRLDKPLVRTQHKRCTTSLSIRELQGQVCKESPEQSTQISDSQKLSKERTEFSRQMKFLVVGSNNNEELVKQLLLKRKGWKELTQGEGLPDFKWIFYKDKYNFKKMGRYGRKRVVNHFQFNHQISTKDSLVKNLQFFCETKKVELFSITPVTFVLDFDSQYCEFNLKQFLSFFQKNDPRENKSTSPYWQLIMTLECFMARQNPDIKKKVTNYCRPFGSDCYFTPNHYLWLLKPTGLNRGRGIELFNSLEQLQQKLLTYFEMMNRKKSKNPEKLFTKKPENQNKYPEEALRQADSSDEKEEKQPGNQSGEEEFEFNTSGLREGESNQYKGESYELEACSFVIQKYIEKPLLIQGRKFDIRVWALLTQKMELYFCKRGYIRLSGQPYSLDRNLNNPFVHFTNNAIQQHSVNYGQFEDGNQLPFEWLVNELPEEEVGQLWRKIKQVTHMAFSSVKKKINPFNRQYCFELFGLDYMIDFQHKAWLIEVNQNPCIECSSPLLADIIPKMLDGAISLTLDQVYSDKVVCPENKDGKNMWECLGRLSANCEYKADQ